MWSFFSRDPTKDFPYEIGEPVAGLEDKCIWTLHKAKRKASTIGEEVSVFIFEVKNGSEHLLDIARSAVKRLKTLRHPSVLAYLDSLETEKVIYLATEHVEPLQNRLKRMSDKNENQKNELYFSWGIFQITRALNFLNNDGNLRHNNVNMWTIFVNEESGEWKLGGVEYMTAVDAVYVPLPGTFQSYHPLQAKEAAKPASKCSVDMWGLGCLIWEAFNGPLTDNSDLKNIDKIPKQLRVVYKELTSGSAENRPNPADVIARCRSNGGFFKNDLVDAVLFLEEIQVKERGEKGRFFAQLASQLESFPDGVGRYKILPQLLAAFEFGDAGSAVLPPLLQLGCQLPDADYQRRVVPCVVKLFASNDRTTRLRLLQQMERFINHLQPATVNEVIFPQIVRGFLDTNPAIRDHTIKSMLHLAPKLDYNNLNVETLRYFAKLQSMDEHGYIRANTTSYLAQIAQNLHPRIRQKVLIGAFVRGTRDPYPPARSAGILALAATQQYFLLQEVAGRILPALCPLTRDVDKGVRDYAFQTIREFLLKLEKVSEDPNLRESMEADVNTATPSLSNAAATWAGWAVTAVTSKLYRSQSDTPKSANPHNTSLLNKPASLEQASSSQSSPSTTATTSSATSMTSLEHDHEHEPQTAGAVHSDSDWNCWDYWDADSNWGEMEQQPSTTTGSSHSTSNISPASHSSKPNDQWASLQEEPEEEAAQGMEEKNESSDAGWEDSEFQPLDDVQPTDTSENTGETSNQTNTTNKYEEALRKREERKLARQKQVEAKRAVKLRTAAGMKLT